MKKPAFFAVAAVAAAVVVVFTAAAFVPVHAAGAAMPAVGESAPAFTLPSQDGSQISLSSFKGKWVVLYFYPKDMTPGCTIEAHNFQRDQAKYDAVGAVILGVSLDSPDSHKEFCTKENLTFRLLADPQHKVVDQYGSMMDGRPLAARNTFLIDPSGKIVKEWTKVDPSVHSEEVLAAIAGMKK